MSTCERIIIQFDNKLPPALQLLPSFSILSRTDSTRTLLRLHREETKIRDGRVRYNHYAPRHIIRIVAIGLGDLNFTCS